jgi:hypothetical protein
MHVGSAGNVFHVEYYKCFCYGDEHKTTRAQESEGGDVKEQAQQGDANAVRCMDGSL